VRRIANHRKKRGNSLDHAHESGWTGLLVQWRGTTETRFPATESKPSCDFESLSGRPSLDLAGTMQISV
jgi:hypothetical protein